jgi:uncharacterized membrane protein YfhO
MILSSDSAVLNQLLDTLGPWPAAIFDRDQQPMILPALDHANETISAVKDHGNEVSIQAQTSDTAYLVLTDTYYPGWEATIDGIPAPVLRCNYAMRAVLLPPGEHHIQCIFLPQSFQVGRALSIASAVLLLGIVLFGYRLQRKSVNLQNSGSEKTT